MSKTKTWKHREWHIRKELFGYKTEFEITYLALYASVVYILLSNELSILTIAICIVLFWGLAIFIIILTVEIERLMERYVGCKGDKCDHPKVYLKEES